MRKLKQKIKQLELEIEAEKKFIQKNKELIKQNPNTYVLLSLAGIAVIPLLLLCLRKPKFKKFVSTTSRTFLFSISKNIVKKLTALS